MTLTHRKIIEVCVESVQDCIMAEQLGADRLEFNSALFLGGLTPSLAGLIKAKDILEIPMIVMIRPRGGDFIYNQSEKEQMLLDAKIMLDHGADGLAFGSLLTNLSLDEEFMESMVDLCKTYKAETVCHRAIDCSLDYFSSIETLINIGCQRILTSGQAEKCTDNLDFLSHTMNTYGKDIEFCLGSGVKSENIAEIVQKTGVHQIHGTFSKWLPSQAEIQGSVQFNYSPLGNYQSLSEEHLKQAIQIFKGE